MLQTEIMFKYSQLKGHKVINKTIAPPERYEYLHFGAREAASVIPLWISATERELPLILKRKCWRDPSASGRMLEPFIRQVCCREEPLFIGKILHAWTSIFATVTATVTDNYKKTANNSKITKTLVVLSRTLSVIVLNISGTTKY